MPILDNLVGQNTLMMPRVAKMYQVAEYFVDFSSVLAVYAFLTSANIYSAILILVVFMTMNMKHIAVTVLIPILAAVAPVCCYFISPDYVFGMFVTSFPKGLTTYSNKSWECLTTASIAWAAFIIVFVIKQVYRKQFGGNINGFLGNH